MADENPFLPAVVPGLDYITSEQNAAMEDLATRRGITLPSVMTKTLYAEEWARVHEEADRDDA